ncbi:hypothetical protein [Lactococcus kimchii]|uniref:hypothetical protein n=1 Tax=Lactococcus sp. S-13 TaxID=2507158 RepID=UPI0010237CFF|nr:hypothetical protein [Lactococcus sp. S-13]RZI49040.1 hypothetical protein EQJ87_06050 [Lactococcus sp. S-13]
MPALDLSHLNEEIKKTQNWSNHRKQMYAKGLLHELYITDGSSNAEHSIIPASDRASTAHLVSEILDQLLAFDGISLINQELESQTANAAKIQFPHLLMLSDQPGIQYILNSNIWLKVLNDKERTLALVVTGDLTGNFTFYTEKIDGSFEQNTLFFNKNGIYCLNKPNVDVLHLTDHALQIN